MIDMSGVAFSLSDSVLENQEIESINKKVNSRPKIEEFFPELVTED